MNDKTREQIEAMKMQTIGVEVEMNNITREKAARKVAEFFGTTAWYAAGEYGYMSWACKDQQGRVWKFQRDISIHGPEAEKCEMVTPILTYEDIETLQAIIRLLRKAGAKSSPSRGCGVHIHIGKGSRTPKTLRNLVNIMAAHEEQIGRAIRIDAGRTGQYCRVVDPRFLDQLNKKKPTTMTELADIWYAGNHADYGRTFRVVITETLKRVVEVNESEIKEPTMDEAVQAVSDWWHNGQIVLEAEDFDGVDFSAAEGGEVGD